MALPFDPDVVKRNARAYGFNTQQASILSHLALDKLRHLHNESGQPVTLERLAEAIKQYASEEVEREHAVAPDIRNRGISILEDMEAELCLLDSSEPPPPPTIKVELDGGSQRKHFKFDDDGLEQYFGKEDPYRDQTEVVSLSMKHHRRDIITAMCARVELAVELGSQLRPEDLVNLYATSRMFHNAVNEHLLSSIRTWIARRAPEAGRIFPFKLYRRHLVPDPAGRTWAAQYEGTETAEAKSGLMKEVRTVPGLRYLQLVLVRDRCCRQIVAMMARNGFLMPKSMYSTLLRLWLLMDIPTSGQRHALLRNRDLWTDVHLYNAQLLFVKLSMMFNDPIYGPFTNELLHLFLGQKGLYPLWQLLTNKKFTTLPELLDLKVRYDLDVPDELYGGGSANESTMHNVPVQDVGMGHYEGWGLGDSHLQRPDELVPVEAVARGLELDEHLVYMMIWGYVDFETGENMVPSEEDIHLSDEEDVLSRVDTTGHWKRKHALKKRFASLTPDEQQKIIQDDEDDRLRALAWTGDTTDYLDQGPSMPYSLDDEINRGYIVRSPRPEAQGAPQVPDRSDTQGWIDFVNAALSTVPPDLDDDHALRAQAWENYHNDEVDADWDWTAWLKQQEDANEVAAAASYDDDDVDDEEADTIMLDSSYQNTPEAADEQPCYYDDEAAAAAAAAAYQQPPCLSEPQDDDDDYGDGGEAETSIIDSYFQDVDETSESSQDLLMHDLISDYFSLEAQGEPSSPVRSFLASQVPDFVWPE